MQSNRSANERKPPRLHRKFLDRVFFAIVGSVAGYMFGGWVYEVAGDHVWSEPRNWLYWYQGLVAGLGGGMAALFAAWLAWQAIQRQIQAAAQDAELARRATLAASNRPLVDRLAIIQADLNAVLRSAAANPEQVPAIGDLLTHCADAELNTITIYRNALSAVSKAGAEYTAGAMKKRTGETTRQKRAEFLQRSRVLYRENLRLSILLTTGRSSVELMLASDKQLNDMARDHFHVEDAVQFLTAEAPEMLAKLAERLRSESNASINSRPEK